MDPKAFLDLAEDLKDSKNEASLRTSVSRSYYALFNLMAQFIEPNFPKALSHSAKDHTTIYESLYNCGNEDVEVVASDLHDLRAERNAADYNLELNTFVENHANLMYIKAKLAMKTFQKEIGTAKGQQTIIEGIKSHNSKLQRPTT